MKPNDRIEIERAGKLETGVVAWAIKSIHPYYRGTTNLGVEFDDGTFAVMYINDEKRIKN